MEHNQGDDIYARMRSSAQIGTMECTHRIPKEKPWEETNALNEHQDALFDLMRHEE